MDPAGASSRACAWCWCRHRLADLHIHRYVRIRKWVQRGIDLRWMGTRCRAVRSVARSGSARRGIGMICDSYRLDGRDEVTDVMWRQDRCWRGDKARAWGRRSRDFHAERGGFPLSLIASRVFCRLTLSTPFAVVTFYSFRAEASISRRARFSRGKCRSHSLLSNSEVRVFRSQETSRQGYR